MVASDEELLKLRDRLRVFAADRDWDQFHNPKNLAMALTAEAGELVEPFQWLTEDQSKRLDSKQLSHVQDETKNQQTPWENTSLSGDFYFKIEKSKKD